MGTECMTAEHRMRTWDGAELFYRAWIPAIPSDRALVVFHRGHEHSGRMAELVADLDLPDVNVFAWDARGHGRSAGDRGAAPTFGALVRDVDEFVRHISVEHGVPIENMVVLAHSVGAAAVATWVHDYAPPIRGMVLATPAFSVRLYVPFAIPLLRLRHKLLGPGHVKSYVSARMLTSDPAQATAYANDPQVFRQIATNVLLGLHDASTRVLDDAGAIQVPTLVLAAQRDAVVSVAAQRRFFERLGAPHKEMEVLAGFRHAIFHEKNRALPIARAQRFIRGLFATHTPPERDGHLHRPPHIEREHERLLKRVPLLSPRGLWFATLRALLKTVGRSSAGMRIGLRYGFDSGLSLDHTYANEARGITWLGRWLDRQYLDAIGWRCIRRRGETLAGLLGAAIRRQEDEGKDVRILDVASGPGRYVLETLHALGTPRATALLQDIEADNLAAGRKLATELGVHGVTFRQGSAFDGASLAATLPRPTLGIASGIYELFPQNERILESLRGLAGAIAPGGLLVYTNQPWHPQIELIARVLTTRDGTPWVMRRRTQAEMDDLVAAAGFRKLETRCDDEGIFSVSLAERVR